MLRSPQVIKVKKPSQTSALTSESGLSDHQYDRLDEANQSGQGLDQTAEPEAVGGGVVDGCVGCLDLILNGRLHGWAKSVREGWMDAESEFHVFFDGKPLSTVSPDVLRHDLLGADGKAQACGFELPLPPECMDGREHEFSLRVSAESDSELFARRLVVPTAASQPRSQPVRGYTDAIIGLFVHGWAYDPLAPAEPVPVELLANGKVSSKALANLPRDDLLGSGLDSEFHAFALRVPNELYDGQTYELQVRECRTGRILDGRDLRLGASDAVGRIEAVEGAYVRGWIDDPFAFGVATQLHLWVDGEQAGLGVADQPREGGSGNQFWLRIPDRFLDNRPHEIAISAVDNPNLVFDATALMLHASATPFEALQRYAGTSYIKGFLAPLAPQRYESMRKNIDLLARRLGEQGEPDLAAIRRDLRNFSLGHHAVIKGFGMSPSAVASIEFAHYEKPQVSVVIPVHNKFTVTYVCLASIAAAFNRATYEVIVVDDGSSDETVNIESTISGITVVRNRAAMGFVMACNAGAEKARGDYIVMLNNDTEVMSGWLDELLEPFSRFDRVGMTGAKLVYPNGVLQEAGGIVWGNGQPWNVGRNGNASDPRYSYTRQVDYLSGACIMLPAALWQQVGGFDRHFAPAYYEDTDLAFNVRSLGYKTVFTPFCEVVHYEGMSNGTDTAGTGLKRFQNINEPKFKAKWSHAYRHNGLIGQVSPDVVKDRQVSHRVLVIDAQTLTPDLDAGSYSATQEIRLLQSLGFKVTFLPSNLAYMAGYTESLQRMGVEVLYAPFINSMADVVESRAQEFDLFYIARYGVAMEIIDRIREARPDARIVLNIHDLHFLRELREALAARDQAHLQKAIHTREEELATLRKADVVVSYSEVEQAIILSHNLDSTRTAACPWVVEVPEVCPDYAVRKDIAFLGGFGHRPNLEAVQWFVSEVMPLLRKQLPGVRFLIYGSKAPENLKALESDDVVLKGYVESTDEVYDTARVFLAPLLTGAGLKGKVIGAFAKGIPTVMTPTAAEGTGARNGLEACIATRAEDWVAAIVRLYSDEKTWTKMSEAGRQLAREEYSFSRGQEKIQAALQLAGVFVNQENAALWSKYPVG